MYEEKRIHHDAVPAAETRSLQVPEACEQLEGALECLAKTTSDMHSRLSNVLRSEPEAANQKEPTEQTLVGLAERIREATRRVRRIDEMYQSILRRLEL